jgi:hypothetical protein
MRGPVHLKRVTLDTTFVCTRAQPWKRSMCSPNVLVLHPDTVDYTMGGADGKFIERQCPNCGYTFAPEHRSTKA